MNSGPHNTNDPNDMHDTHDTKETNDPKTLDAVPNLVGLFRLFSEMLLSKLNLQL